MNTHPVIPAKAGIQDSGIARYCEEQHQATILDSRFRGNDGSGIGAGLTTATC
jgi:hypothetical protein